MPQISTAGLTPEQLHLWCIALNDGQICGKAQGHYTQNPYKITEPLFWAWRTGWLEGIKPHILRELEQKGVSEDARSIVSVVFDMNLTS